MRKYKPFGEQQGTVAEIYAAIYIAAYGTKRATMT